MVREAEFEPLAEIAALVLLDELLEGVFGLGLRKGAGGRRARGEAGKHGAAAEAAVRSDFQGHRAAI